MPGLRTFISDDHGDRLQGWSLLTHIWMHVSNQQAGTTGEKLKTRELLVFMSTSTSLCFIDIDYMMNGNITKCVDYLIGELCFSVQVFWARELLDEQGVLGKRISR